MQSWMLPGSPRPRLQSGGLAMTIWHERHIPTPDGRLAWYEADRERRRVLRQQRDEAVRRGDQETCRAIDHEWLEMNSRSSFYSREKAAESLAEMRAAGASPDRTIAPLLWPSVAEALTRLPERLPQVQAPVLALYGYQDFEPITQAYLLREWMPQTQICLINECGHVPWKEQPTAFYAALDRFLTDM